MSRPPHHRATRTAALIASLMVATAVKAQNDSYCPDFNGRLPPELRAASDGWMNFDGELSLKMLRGHVVWLEFSFIACGGCQMMKPHLQGLQHRYGPEGLVVIEVNNGEIDTREALGEEIQHLKPNCPVLWDKDGRTCDAYGVCRYGTAYLIGADGRIIWGGNPIDLTVLDMWRMVRGALSNVDLNALQRANDPFLAHRLASDVPESHPSPAANEADASAIRYTLGWQFTICTTDNSMLIEGVAPDSPARRAGLRAGDAIVAIDDLVLSEIPFQKLKAKIHQLEESPAMVTLVVQRKDEELTLTVTPTPARK